MRGFEGHTMNAMSRPSGICCDTNGNIVVADSKNLRVVVYNNTLNYVGEITMYPNNNDSPKVSSTRDRPCDVAILPNGRLVVVLETAPDARDVFNAEKPYIRIY